MPKKTFKRAGELKLGLIVPVKANQKGLAELCSEAFGYFKTANARSVHQSCSLEPRGLVVKSCRTLPINARTLPGEPGWSKLAKTMIEVRRSWEPKAGKGQGAGSEVQLYLSNRKLSAKQAASWIERHWHVENKAHLRLDVRFEEDRCSRAGAAENTLAMLRGLALNLDKGGPTFQRKLMWSARLDSLCKSIKFWRT